MKVPPFREKNHLLRFSAGLFLIYLIFINPSPDTSYVLPQLHLAVSLVDQGSVALSSYRGRDVAFFNGRFLSGHPPGAAFLAAGVYRVFRPLFPSEADGRTIFWLNVLSIVLISIPLSVLAAVLFLRLARTLPVNSDALKWTLILVVLGTVSFGYSGAFYKKGLAGVMAFLAAYLVWPQRRKNKANALERVSSPVRHFSIGLLAGFGVAIDYPMVVFIPFWLAYFWRKRIPRYGIFWFLAGSAVMALILLAYHQAAFGHPLRTSYAFRFHSWDAPVYTGFSAARLWRILFGLRCGLVPYVPVLLVAAAGWWISVRKRVFRDEMVWLIAAPAATYMLFYSFWSTGDMCGGESLIVRMMVPLFPLVLLPVAAGWERTPRGLALGAAALSLIFAYLGAQSFFSPAASYPLIYAAKNAAASLGSGELFSRFLPRLIGVETPLSLPGGHFSPLLSEPLRLLKLMGTQLAFSAVQFALIAGIWRRILRKPLQALWDDVEG